MKNFLSLAVLLVFFSGCSLPEFTQIEDKKQEIQKNFNESKQNFSDLVDDVDKKFTEISENIEEKKNAIDQKIKHFEEAKASLDKLFGSENDPQKKAEILTQLEEISTSEVSLREKKQKNEEMARLQKQIEDLQAQMKQLEES